MAKKRLESREDVEKLVDQFYGRVRVDELIGPIFNDIAKVDWSTHTKKIYDFWDTLLFGAENYEGRPFPPHIPLGLQPEHFKRWLELFFLTVDESFEGQKADEVKMRALNIGSNFLRNLRAMGKV
jgi:hemoglobin